MGEQLGKENYWKIVFVDGEPYTELLMEEKIKGKVSYQLTFLKNGPFQYDIQENLTPQYIGVSWDENYKKWKTELIHKGMKYSGGVFDKKEHAAMKVNLLCDKYGVERKNPTIDMKLFGAHELQENLTSQYIGVSWDKNYKKWQTELMHKEKKYSGGVFDNEEQAAMK